jgi:Fic family protein
MFYISSYLERNRDVYYERLRAISSEGDWNGWISFFLKALIEQAEENSRKAKAILALYNSMKQRVPEITHSQHSIQAIDTIFSRPIFNSAYFIKKSEINKMTAQRILREMKESGILIVSRERRGSRSALYEFSELIDITERDEV